MFLSPRKALVRTCRQNGFVAVLEILTACLIAGLRMTQGVRLLHAAARLQSFHHFVVLVTTAKRCVNVLAQRGQSPLHRGGLVCANKANETGETQRICCLDRTVEDAGPYRVVRTRRARRYTSVILSPRTNAGVGISTSATKREARFEHA